MKHTLNYLFMAHPVSHKNMERAFSPCSIFVLTFPGALPQADMFRAFSASFIIRLRLTNTADL
jgi:hypothetical protein